MHTLFLCALVQENIDTSLVPLESDNYEDLDSIQVANLSVCSCAVKHRDQPCAIAVTPKKICSSYKWLISKHQCTAARFRPKCMPCFSVLLFRKTLTPILCHCNHNYVDLLLIQVAIHQTPVHCNRVQAKMHALFLCAPVQENIDTSLVQQCGSIKACKELAFASECTP